MQKGICKNCKNPKPVDELEKYWGWCRHCYDIAVDNREMTGKEVARQKRMTHGKRK